MNETIRARLERLQITLPALSAPNHNYVTSTVSGTTVFMAGKTPTADFPHRGLLGRDLDTDQGYAAARSCAVHTLAQIEQDCGLENVRLLKVNGYVASADGFNEQPQVVNGASDTFTDVLAGDGEHARTAIGVAQLPGGWPVEIEVVLELNGAAGVA